MKIAVIHLDLTTESGDPRMALSCAQAYRDLGHDVTVYTAEYNRDIFPDLQHGIAIRVIPPPMPLASLVGARSMGARIRERIRRIKGYHAAVKKIFAAMDRDIALLHFQNDDSYKIGVWYKKINPAVKTVWIMHNPPFFRSPKGSMSANALSRGSAFVQMRMARRFAKGIDAVVTYDRDKEAAAHVLGIRAKILGIPVASEKFLAPVKSVDAGQPIHLIGVGALSPARRFEDIIAAAAILKQRRYHPKVVLICKDYWQDKSYREQFERYIEQSGIRGDIDARFAGATEEELIAAIKAASIFIFPNNVKIWGMAAFEAMAAGLPVVVNRMTSVADMLSDGENALFVDSERPDEIADKVQSLVEHPDVYRSIAQRGQDFVVKNLQWDHYVKEIIAFAYHE